MTALPQQPSGGSIKWVYVAFPAPQLVLPSAALVCRASAWHTATAIRSTWSHLSWCASWPRSSRREGGCVSGRLSCIADMLLGVAWAIALLCAVDGSTLIARCALFSAISLRVGPYI